MLYRLRLGLGKLRNHTGGPGGLPPGFGFGLGKLRYNTEGLAAWLLSQGHDDGMV